MLAEFFKSKCLVIALLLPMTAIAAGNQGFSLQLQGPQVHTPSSPAKYGPVAKSDTLWSIATKTRPSADLNIYQTMEAILRLNPHAFLDGDINKVIDGSYLKLPSASMIRAIDASYLQEKSSPLAQNSIDKAVVKKPVSKKPTETVKPVSPAIQSSELKSLEGQLAASNEDLLLSSETNRRLKIQLESIRIELASLKEQIAEDNQLKIDLKKLIEDQKSQISQLQSEIENSQKQAEIDKDTNMISWLIIGVASVLILLVSVWFGLWLKNRSDLQAVEEDSNLFEADNAVDELSEYLATDSYAVDPEVSKPEADNVEMAQDAFSIADVEETLNFNSEMGSDNELPLNFEPEIIISEPETPEIITDTPEESNSEFSEIDLTLDDETTSFDGDDNTPDLSWRDELKAGADADDDTEESLIPVTPSTSGAEYQEDLDEIDNMLAQFRETPVADEPAEEAQAAEAQVTEPAAKAQEETPAEPAIAELDDAVDEFDIDSLIEQTPTVDLAASEPEPTEIMPEAKGQTVDEMLAELDGQIEPESPAKVENNAVDELDIDALMAENNAATSVESIDDILADNASDLADALLEENAPSSAEDEMALPDEPELGVPDLEEPEAPVANETKPPAGSETKAAVSANETKSPAGSETKVAVSANETKSPAGSETKAASNVDNSMDDIESMLSEFGQNAFSNAPSDQMPIDPAVAQAEEFIDIDKLLNEAGETPAELADEPYDQVTLDVGLDEFSNSVIDDNNTSVDDDSNRIGAQLDLARAYLEIEDKDGARSILEPLSEQGDIDQQIEIQQLLARL